jgi:hypothetical protein
MLVQFLDLFSLFFKLFIKTLRSPLLPRLSVTGGLRLNFGGVGFLCLVRLGAESVLDFRALCHCDCP